MKLIELRNNAYNVTYRAMNGKDITVRNVKSSDPVISYTPGKAPFILNGKRIPDPKTIILNGKCCLDFGRNGGIKEMTHSLDILPGIHPTAIGVNINSEPSAKDRAETIEEHISPPALPATTGEILKRQGCNQRTIEKVCDLSHNPAPVEPFRPATTRQTWYLFTLVGKDWRKYISKWNLDTHKASKLISIALNLRKAA